MGLQDVQVRGRVRRVPRRLALAASGAGAGGRARRAAGLAVHPDAGGLRAERRGGHGAQLGRASPASPMSAGAGRTWARSSSRRCAPPTRSRCATASRAPSSTAWAFLTRWPPTWCTRSACSSRSSPTRRPTSWSSRPRPRLLERMGHRPVARALATSSHLRGLRIRLLMAGAATGHDSVADLERVADHIREVDPGREVEVRTERRPLDVVRPDPAGPDRHRHLAARADRGGGVRAPAGHAAPGQARAVRRALGRPDAVQRAAAAARRRPRRRAGGGGTAGGPGSGPVS